MRVGFAPGDLVAAVSMRCPVQHVPYVGPYMMNLPLAFGGAFS